tara:strand:- start:3676 stop:4233 length:558 start_codon:yes stop_codon:yes gene_type:complete
MKKLLALLLLSPLVGGEDLLLVNSGFGRWLDDRPTEYFDILSNETIGTIRSFACSITTNKEGENEYNSTVTSHHKNDNNLEKKDTAIKVIIHIADALGYAEVNYGSTIYPIAEQRFFTNYLYGDEKSLAGKIGTKNPNSLLESGTDRGPEGGGWFIEMDTNILTVYAGAYDIEFTKNCIWNDINL